MAVGNSKFLVSNPKINRLQSSKRGACYRECSLNKKELVAQRHQSHMK
jgi:hypothetical protein